MATLQQIRTAVEDILSDVVDSSVYFEDYTTRLINEVQQTICDSWSWNFLRKRQTYNAIINTSLSNDLAVGDVVADLEDADSYPSTGALMSHYNTILYAGKSGNQLIGVSGQQILLPEGAIVYPLYTLPTDYNRQPEVRILRNSDVVYNYVDFYGLADARQYPSQRFSIINNGATQYLFVDKVRDGDIIALLYLAKAEIMVDDDDVSIIPDQYTTSVLARMVAGRAMMERGDNIDGVGNDMIAMAERAMLQMKKKFGSETTGFSHQLRNAYQKNFGRVYSKINRM